VNKLKSAGGILVVVMFIGSILSLTAHAQGRERDDLVIWVNTKSGVYHCPDSKWYGHTKHGTYMKQRQAIDEGYKPAGGNVCDGAARGETVPATGTRCGYERWPVKILADPDKKRVNFRPIDSTITTLAALPVPHVRYPQDRRINEAELHVYRVRVKLLRVREEVDSDLHLIVGERKNPAVTMIAEIPASYCAIGTGYERAYDKSRETVLRMPVGSLVEIEGVGFFDVIHGQRGRAPNGFELHPVLSVRIVP
jgi:hypothetical protein